MCLASFRVAKAHFKRFLENKGQPDHQIIEHKSFLEREEDVQQQEIPSNRQILSAPARTSCVSTSDNISEDSEDENPPFPQQQLGVQMHSEDAVLRARQQPQLREQPHVSPHRVQETRTAARGARGAWGRSDGASEEPPSVLLSRSTAIDEAMEQQPGVLTCSDDASLRIHVGGMTHKPAPTQDDLVQLFEKRGCSVVDVEWVADDKRPSRSDAPRVRFAFVDLKDLDSFNTATQLHDKEVDGFGKLKISVARMKAAP